MGYVLSARSSRSYISSKNNQSSRKDQSSRKGIPLIGSAKPMTGNVTNKKCNYGVRKLNEKECRRIFEKRYGVEFPTIRPDWLPSPHANKNGKRRNLELDGYNPMNSSLNYDDVSTTGLAFEYDGIQHSEPGHFGMDQQAFDRLVERDRQTTRLCKQLGVTLIRIPHTVKFKDLESYIIDQLQDYDRRRSSQSKRSRCVIC